MQSFTSILDDNQIKKINKKFKSFRIFISNPNILFFYKTKDISISIFKNKKLLLQGNNADAFYQNLFNKTQVTKKNISFDKGYIGCDEVGVGDYFGGLVTCAVYLDKKNEIILRKIGVKDSKNLSNLQMQQMFKEIIKYVKFSCLSFKPEKYNEMINKFHNTHILKAYMHDLTIKDLIKKHHLKNAPIVMDEFVNENKYYSYFEKININNPQIISIFETKAENKYLAVAAASIIARIYFLKQVNELSINLKRQLLLGSSNPKIIDIAKDIYKKGKEPLLKKYVKIDFKTTKKFIINE
ncbi:MAG: ribonuclease HIII [Mycoplasmataceae bacterium]|nr:ribonuclease HIII [Mycoplasmataceae bacterium]